MLERWFHACDGLFFDRLSNDSVRILKTDGKRPEEGGKVEFDMTLDDGTWASVVLTMSHFNERPNDWHKWMEHHTGKKDILTQ